MNYNSVILTTALGLVLLSTNGCAFGTRHAKITYPPDTKAAKAATNSPPAGMLGRIAVQQFDDDRADKRVVGHVRNGFGMKTAEVVCDTEDINSLVTEAVRGELQKAGYEVVNTDAAADASTPVLMGSLTSLYCDAYMSYDGSATLVVRVSRAGKEVFKKSYEGKGSVGINWGASGTSYGRSLSLALLDAIEVMKRDLPTALKQ